MTSWGHYNGAEPSAILALFQLPGSNAIEAAKDAKKLMEELKKRFPPDMDYNIAIDTTVKSVTRRDSRNRQRLLGGAGAGDARWFLFSCKAGGRH